MPTFGHAAKAGHRGSALLARAVITWSSMPIRQLFPRHFPIALPRPRARVVVESFAPTRVGRTEGRFARPIKGVGGDEEGAHPSVEVVLP